MKKLIKYMAVALSFAVIFGVCGCDTNQAYEREYKPVYEAGLEITYLLGEMASSDDYMSMYTGSTPVTDVVKEIGKGDYTKPKAVYEVIISDEVIDTLAETESMPDISEELKVLLKDKVRAVLVTHFNGMAGVEKLAAASICTASKTFINPIAEDTILIYTYENGYPIAVTINAEYDGSASASGTFVMVDGFDTIESIESYFSGIEVEVTEITQ